MKCILLCPGPSLARLENVPSCALVVAVNSSAAAFDCDVWAACDHSLIASLYLEVLKRPRVPNLFTAVNSARQLVRQGVAWPRSVSYVEELFPFADPTGIEMHAWTVFTATAAMVYLARAGASQISVFGADWSGDADFRGNQNPEGRTPRRWDEEISTWNRVVAGLGRRGVSVKHCEL